MRLDLNGATLGGSSNKVVGVLNAVNGSIYGILEAAANSVINLNGTYLYGPTAVRANATMNWWAGRFAQGFSLLVENGAVLNLLGGGEKDIGGPRHYCCRRCFPGPRLKPNPLPARTTCDKSDSLWECTSRTPLSR